MQMLANQQGWKFKEEAQFHAQIARGKIGEVSVHLLLPLTYMNESGRSVRKYLDFYKLGTQQLIVATDDVALEFGRMRVRSIGSAGGHNGLKSIQEHMHTQCYVRLRMGVGRGDSNRALADHVLDGFTADEGAVLASLLERGADTLRQLLVENVETVMNKINIKEN